MFDIKSKRLEELVDFPTEFSIKAIGKKSNTFEDEVLNLIKSKCNIDTKKSGVKQSKGDKYLSVTITFQAKDADHVRLIYKLVSEMESVVMCL